MAYALLVLSALFWSGNFVLGRAMNAEIPPVGLAFWRWFAALLILAIFSLSIVIKQKSIIKKNIKYLLVQALLGVACFNTLIYLAMQTTTAINAVLVNSAIPVLIVVVSWVMFKEKITIRQSIGVLISLSGVLLIISKDNPSSLLNLDFNKGDLLVICAATCWSIYSSNLKRIPKDLHPFSFMTTIMFFGVIMILPFYIYETINKAPVLLTQNTILTVLYVAIFASILAFIFWNRAIKEVGANKAGPFVHLMPVFSIILAVIFLNESLFMYHIKGMVLVFSGITITTLKRFH
jgi:drug/metabolite transporter (DMT)-like permease